MPTITGTMTAIIEGTTIEMPSIAGSPAPTAADGSQRFGAGARGRHVKWFVGSGATHSRLLAESVLRHSGRLPSNRLCESSSIS